jgi:hypothetical protein
LDNASTPSASGGCADASIQACNQRRLHPQHAAATTQRAVIKEVLESNQTLHRSGGRKIYFNLALFVCVVVIKCPNEDTGERDHENISRSIISVPVLMRGTPCAFVQRMC